MIVCAHGDVSEYCKSHGMVICDTWDGDIREYRGSQSVLVTDSDISEMEYYFQKGELLSRGVELISTRYVDDLKLSEYLVYYNQRRKEKYGGRPVFDDADVIDRVLELRAAGLSFRAIREDSMVRKKDGRKLCISTIGSILRRAQHE